MKSKWLLIILVLVLAACASQPASEPAAPPADAPAEEPPEPTKPPEPTEVPVPMGRIVFSSNRGENPGILGLHVLDVETGEYTELKTGLLVSFFPKWSPDGGQVLYVDPLPWNIYTVNADGSEITQITNFRSNNGDWSPDGSQIVFQSDHDNEPQDTPDLYIIGADGENLTEILDDPEIIDFSPRWSPDGGEVLFISTRSGKMEMHTLDLADSAVQQISDMEASITEAVWSPDGTRIALSVDDDGASNIYVVDADGKTNLVKLTDDGKANLYPTWSPDGSRVAYSSKASGNTDLWMVNADASERVQLTDDEWDDLFPDWAP